MDDKRTPELSDEALDLVAGGLSMGSSFSGISTISTSGPSVAGPGGSGLTIGGKDRISTRLPTPDADIFVQMRNAGTFEQYLRDLDEYGRQHAEWQDKYAPGGHITPESRALAGPEPIRPNPYDYL